MPLVSDCSATTLAQLYQEVLDSQLTVLDTPEGEVVRGEKFMEFYPDEQKLQRLALDLLFTPVETTAD